MIKIDGEAGRERVTLGWTLDVRKRGHGGFIFNVRDNKQQSLGPEWSLSEVGTPPPHDSDIPHGLVESNTHPHTCVSIFGLFYVKYY